ncbi:flagellar hook assembly protein FlgD [Geopseudomonas guangdongensis]|uniref:Basal-body rod modification protein FlgD n=1 Tax=Geopseudomonas guangdongensis TaxID=1245526 RepID=A0A1H2EQP0_9GAMM|nr:flagellar hook assembly protein FlgD [Pseudomonas guangdongensis]SDT97349.1 flagellar basal-body rod modification protein FlgD [Pseudomonas guangdongensis]
MTTTTFDPQSVARLNGVGSSAAAEKKASSDLRDNFMTLLVTQLKNQDPLKPMENAELTSQLAQINTVSGIEELNTTLKGINGQIEAGQTLQAAALIGKGVLVPGDRVLVGADAEGNPVATPFGLDLDKAADSVVVTITDNAGQVVRQFDLGALKAGVDSFVWDGTGADGTAVPAGSYKFNIEASSEGKAVEVTGLSYGLVGGVSISDSGPMLDLGPTLGRVDLQAVRQIL